MDRIKQLINSVEENMKNTRTTKDSANEIAISIPSPSVSLFVG